MSEYQYYEFLALDRPLTAEQHERKPTLQERFDRAGLPGA